MFEKPYWTWTCRCGFDDNRNTDKKCKSCGTKITCVQAGGHTILAGENECSGGCGLKREEFTFQEKITLEAMGATKR